MHSQARGQPEPEQRTCRSAHYRPPSSARATGPDSATARHCIHKPAGSPNQNSAHADQHIIPHRLGQSAPQLGIAFTSPRAARTRTAHMQISTLSPTELCSCHWASQRHSWALHSQARGQPEPEQRTCRSAHYRPPSSARATGIAFTSPRAARTRTAHMQISTLSPTELCSCHWAASTTAGHCIHKPAGSPNQNSAHADQHIIAHRALLVPLGQSAPQLGIAFTSPRAARTRTAHMQISTLSLTELCSGITEPVSATARHCIHKPEGSPNQNSAHADQHIIAHRALLVPLGQSATQLGIAFTSPRAARTRTAHMQISTLSPTELCSCH